MCNDMINDLTDEAQDNAFGGSGTGEAGSCTRVEAAFQAVGAAIREVVQNLADGFGGFFG